GAPKRGIWTMPGLFCQNQSAEAWSVVCRVTQSRCPAVAATAAPRTPRAAVGANERSATVAPRPEQVGIEAGRVAGVAGRPDQIDLHEHGVLVAVQTELVDHLGVTRGLPLDPVLLATA